MKNLCAQKLPAVAKLGVRRADYRGGVRYLILIKYKKVDGAEFIPHLDTLRHLIKTVRRTGIKINYSKGFNPHMLIFMSSPVALGLKSESEFCLFDTECKASEFMPLFNANTPKGIKCLSAYDVKGKVKIVSDVTSAIYEIKGINAFDVQEILNSDTFTVYDKRAGEEKNVRDRIKNLYFEGGVLYAELSFGNVMLRPDYLIDALLIRYGGEHPTAIKKDVKFLDGLSLEEYLEKENA